MDTETLLKILACPVCHGELSAAEGNEPGFICENCQIVYPVREGIPIMIINEAIRLSEWKNRK